MNALLGSGQRSFRVLRILQCDDRAVLRRRGCRLRSPTLRQLHRQEVAGAQGAEEFLLERVPLGGERRRRREAVSDGVLVLRGTPGVQTTLSVAAHHALRAGRHRLGR